ncbi:MAG: four helix bundle protein [Bacteroidales bacterium]|nr:four helix bundle protein [Bacteroidales bacterium]
MYKSFVEMPVWQKAHKLSIEVYQVTVNLPRSEDYGLTSQIRRSSNSVSANIAEGYGRKMKKDKAHFYTIARGSAFETQNHLLYGNKVQYFNDAITKELFEEYSLLIFDLNKLISYLINPQS